MAYPIIIDPNALENLNIGHGYHPPQHMNNIAMGVNSNVTANNSIGIGLRCICHIEDSVFIGENKDPCDIPGMFQVGIPTVFNNKVYLSKDDIREGKDLKHIIDSLLTKVNELTKKVDQLEHSPGGIKYHEAKLRFHKRCNSI